MKGARISLKHYHDRGDIYENFTEVLNELCICLASIGQVFSNVKDLREIDLMVIEDVLKFHFS